VSVTYCKLTITLNYILFIDLYGCREKKGEGGEPSPP
jgi:hypothetical protein